MFEEIKSFDIDFFDEVSSEMSTNVVSIIQDYAVTVVLYYLYKNGMIDNLVFKGGTAIKKIYFPDARFSVDLDFDCKYKLDDPTRYGLEFEAKLKSLVDAVLGSAYIYEVERIETSSWLFFNVKYRVFDYDELTRIDIDYGPSGTNYLQKRVFAKPYVEEEFSVDVYPIETILEQKVVSLIDRNTAKDLWDIYFLYAIKNVRPTRPIKSIVDEYNRESKIKYDLKKALFVVEEIVSERDFMILSEIYIPTDLRCDFATVVREVKEFFSEYWNFY